MKVFYDTEFIEDGRTIELISIGLVADNGEEYYAVNSDMPVENIRKRDWLVRNVVPSLPLTRGEVTRLDGQAIFSLDTRDVRVKPQWVIANEVREWFRSLDDGRDCLELWAWYGAYDHVKLAQLWGRMVALPKHIPMWTNDIRQLVLMAERVTGTKIEVPEQPSGNHNALDDARFNQVRYQWLREQLLPYRDTPALAML